MGGGLSVLGGICPRSPWLRPFYNQKGIKCYLIVHANNQQKQIQEQQIIVWFWERSLLILLVRNDLVYLQLCELPTEFCVYKKRDSFRKECPNFRATRIINWTCFRKYLNKWRDLLIVFIKIRCCWRHLNMKPGQY